MSDTASLLQTSDVTPSPEVIEETESLLRELLWSTRAERVVILVSLKGRWCVSSASGVDIKSFWTAAPVSLSVIERVISTGEDVVVTDALDSESFQERDSIFLGGMRSIACVADGTVAVYLDNRVDNGAFFPADVEKIKAMIQRARARLSEAR